MFDSIAIFLDNDILFITVIFVMLFFTEKREKKLKKFIFILLLAFAFSLVIKQIINRERPCLETPSLVECPTTPSFPSAHALIASTVMIGFLNKKTFLLYLSFALFVSYTRIYLGVHTVEDVMGGFAFAPLVYAIGDVLWRDYIERVW